MPPCGGQALSAWFVQSRVEKVEGWKERSAWMSRSVSTEGSFVQLSRAGCGTSIFTRCKRLEVWKRVKFRGGGLFYRRGPPPS